MIKALENFTYYLDNRPVQVYSGQVVSFPEGDETYLIETGKAEESEGGSSGYKVETTKNYLIPEQTFTVVDNEGTPYAEIDGNTEYFYNIIQELLDAGENNREVVCYFDGTKCKGLVQKGNPSTGYVPLITIINNDESIASFCTHRVDGDDVGFESYALPGLEIGGSYSISVYAESYAVTKSDDFCKAIGYKVETTEDDPPITVVTVEDDFKKAVNNANLFYVIDTVYESGDCKVSISYEELLAVYNSGIPTYLRIGNVIVPSSTNLGEYSRIIYNKHNNSFGCGTWTISPETMMVEYENVTINLPSQS